MMIKARRFIACLRSSSGARSGSVLLSLDIGRPDHFAPSLRLVGNAGLNAGERDSLIEAAWSRLGCDSAKPLGMVK
jgi:hypothetical protein